MRSVIMKYKITIFSILSLLGLIIVILSLKFSAFFDITYSVETEEVASITLRQGVSQDEFMKLVNEIGLDNATKRTDIIVFESIIDADKVKILNVYGEGGHSALVYQNGSFFSKGFKESNLVRTPSNND